MKTINKGLIIAAAVAAIGGGSLVAMAQPAGPGNGPPGCGPMGFMHGGWGRGHGGPGFGDPAARLGAIKADLAIRPEQTAAWDVYAKAVQDSATQMQTLRASVDVDALQTMPWKDMQAFMGNLHDKRAQAYVAVKTAAKTLLASLDDVQKGKAASELPGLVHVGAGNGRHGGPGMMGYGMGMMPWGGPR